MPGERDLYLMLDRCPIGICRTTEDGSLRYANPALAQLLGYTVEELRTINLDRDVYVDPADRTRLIEASRASGFIDGARVRWRRRDGRTITVQIHAHIVETDDGKRGFDASILDVTQLEATNAELEGANAELERTARILELVIRQMPAIYWVVDPSLAIVRTGGAVLDLLGYAPHRFVGATLQAAHAHEPGSVDPIVYHQRALAGETVSYDTEYRGKQLATTVAPLRASDGTIIGAIGTSLDVTAARQLERRMVDAQRAESLGVLAGGLAHDFNNLLVAVLGNADLALREVSSGSPGRAALQNIRDAGLRAAELTDQLLAYAGRGGAGTKHVQPALVLGELLRIAAPSFPPQLAIHVDVPADLTVRADSSQLRQVLLNLIANSRDALGDRPGQITVRARRVQRDGSAEPDDILPTPGGTFVEIEVADDGPGMDPEVRRHVFEPFYTTKASGHGLGLAAVLGIVRAHGGGVRLISSPGRGARFQILWPAATSEPQRLARSSTPPSAIRTVLVIDDEDLVRDVVARMIEDLGYATLTAADGVAGLSLVDAHPVDLVLVDMTMPGMSGAEVVGALRSRRPGLPVVVCSGFDREGHGPVEADAYLPKPFRIEALEDTLAKMLS